jgi:hypothetical protein
MSPAGILALRQIANALIYIGSLEIASTGRMTSYSEVTYVGEVMSG